MTLSEGRVKSLGAVSWIPGGWIILAVIVWLGGVQSEPVRNLIFSPVVICFVSLLAIALTVFYCVLISRETILTSNQKYNWGWFVFLLHAAAFPVVWNRFVWKKLRRPDEYEEEKPARQPMTFTRNQAIVLGIISVLPCCSVGLLFLAMLIGARTEATKIFLISSLLNAVLFTNVLTLALIVYYIILIRRETDLTSNQKHSWGWLIVLIHAMAFPVVWYQFVWPKAVRPARTNWPGASTRRSATWLGILSWAPLCLVVLFIGTLIFAGPVLRSPERMVPFLVVTMTIIGLGTVGLMVYYSMIISRNRDLTSEQKHHWYWIVFLLGFWMFPVLWFKFGRSNAGPGGDTMTGQTTDGENTDG